jgi:hypothetical protein
VLGRFLLGREGEEAALATISDPRSRCETYYYLGLRAESDGAIRDAARWYTRCIETGQGYNGEYQWAYKRLHEWAARSTSLARLEDEAKRRRARSLAVAGN